MDQYPINVAKQAYYFEIDDDELNFNYQCFSCNEPITNPLCQECVCKDYLQWLNESNIKKNLKNKVTKFLNENRLNDGISIECISCHEKRTHLCPSCVTWFLYKITRDSKLKEEKLTEFLYIFNLDLEDKYLYDKLENLGGY